jgi:hypothetical protein
MAREQIDTQPLNYTRKDLLKARAGFIFKKYKTHIIAGAVMLATAASAVARCEHSKVRPTANMLMVETIVKEDGKKEPEKKLSEKQQKLNDGLIDASARGKTWLAGQLLDEGAHIDARDSDGYTPLMRAVLNNHRKTADLLLERGADEDVKNRWGNSVDDMTTDAKMKAVLRKPRY